MKAKICFSNEIHKVSNLPETLQGIHQLIDKLFHERLPESFTLQYLDSDGDKVLIADEKDFAEFKLFSSQLKAGNPIVKIFVVPREQQMPSKIISVEESIQHSIQEVEGYHVIEKAEEELPQNNKAQPSIQNEEPKELAEKAPIEVEKREEKEIERKVEESIIEEVKEDCSFSLSTIPEKKLEASQINGDSRILIDVNTLEQLMSSMIEKNLSKIIEAKKEDAPKKEEAPKVEKKENKFVHHGIACAGCGALSIVGVRYKCTFCFNFNYCESCEETREHAHNFIKIKGKDLINAPKPNFDNKPIFIKPNNNIFHNQKPKKFGKKEDKYPTLIFGPENDYYKALKEKAIKLQKCFPQAEFEVLMTYINGAPDDLSEEELIENFKH